MKLCLEVLFYTELITFGKRSSYFFKSSNTWAAANEWVLGTPEGSEGPVQRVGADVGSLLQHLLGRFLNKVIQIFICVCGETDRKLEKLLTALTSVKFISKRGLDYKCKYLSTSVPGNNMFWRRHWLLQTVSLTSASLLSQYSTKQVKHLSVILDFLYRSICYCQIVCSSPQLGGKKYQGSVFYLLNEVTLYWIGTSSVPVLTKGRSYQKYLLLWGVCGSCKNIKISLLYGTYIFVIERWHNYSWNMLLCRRYL